MARFSESNPFERMAKIESFYCKMKGLKKSALCRIGIGAFGNVYKATNKNGDCWAVKFTDCRAFCMNEGKDYGTYKNRIEKRVISEIQTLKQIRDIKPSGHENIIKIMDAGALYIEDEEIYYMEMELLTTVSHNKDFYNELDAMMMGIDIANALACLHHDSEFMDCLAHRDIKPDNILFRAEERQFVLSDFNVSKNMSGTATGTKIGTPCTMPPEVEKGYYGKSTDLYSLAATIYYILNNGVYHERKGCAERVSSPKNGSTALKKLVVDQLSYSKSRRPYDTADDFKAAIFEIMKKRCYELADKAEKSGTASDIAKAEEYADMYMDRAGFDPVLAGKLKMDDPLRDEELPFGPQDDQQGNAGDPKNHGGSDPHKTGEEIEFTNGEVIRIISTHSEADTYYYYVELLKPELPFGIRKKKVLKLTDGTYSYVVDETTLKNVYPNLWENDPDFRICVRFKNACYSGQIKDRRPDGEGQMRYYNGDVYTGSFRNGRRDGDGIYVWSDDDRYSCYKGEYKDNSRHGVGTMVLKNGRMQNGLWDKGEKLVNPNSKESSRGTWFWSESQQKWIAEE